MATLEKILQTLAPKLDASIPYTEILRSNGYRLPEDILLAGTGRALSDICGLPLGDAQKLWKAAGGRIGENTSSRIWHVNGCSQASSKLPGLLSCQVLPTAVSEPSGRS